jgi:hypothetical protein
MRRKLVVLSLLLVATVSAASGKNRTHIQQKNVCFNCEYCDGRYCYNCVASAC